MRLTGAQKTAITSSAKNGFKNEAIAKLISQLYAHG